MVAVDDIDVEVASGFRASHLLARWSSRSKTVTLAPCFNQSSAIFVPMGEAPTMMTKQLGEVGDLMPKRDEGRIELVEANHRNSNTIANLEDAVVVRNETPLPVTLHAHDVWQAVNEVFSHFSERASYEVDGDWPMSNSMT